MLGNPDPEHRDLPHLRLEALQLLKEQLHLTPAEYVMETKRLMSPNTDQTHDSTTTASAAVMPQTPPHQQQPLVTPQHQQQPQVYVPQTMHPPASIYQHHLMQQPTYATQHYGQQTFPSPFFINQAQSFAHPAHQVFPGQQPVLQPYWNFPGAASGPNPTPFSPQLQVTDVTAAASLSAASAPPAADVGHLMETSVDSVARSAPLPISNVPVRHVAVPNSNSRTHPVGNTDRSVLSDVSLADSYQTNSTVRAKWYDTGIICRDETALLNVWTNDDVFSDYPYRSEPGGRLFQKKRICAVQGCHYRIRALYNEGLEVWSIQKSRNYNTHNHSMDCREELIHHLNRGLPESLKEQVDAIIRTNPSIATPSHVVDSIQNLPAYSNSILFIDQDVFELFRTMVRNYLYNRERNRVTTYDGTISHIDPNVLVPPARFNYSQNFASLSDLSEYCHLPATKLKWDPIYFENPTEAELKV
jgi:hypothetical protein